VIVTVSFAAEVFMLQGMSPGGVVSLPTSIELVKLVGRVGVGVKERCEELFRILVVVGEYRIKWEWSEGDVDDSQVGRWGFSIESRHPFILLRGLVL